MSAKQRGLMDNSTLSTLNVVITIVGFIATIASLVLAIGAIWLSFVFYKMSNDASKETTKAAKDIQSSVERLEKIFDKLYSDTFSMMKDTVTDMRHHIWKRPEHVKDFKEEDDKVGEIKSSITQEIIEIIDEKFKDFGENSNKIKELESSINGILQSSLEEKVSEPSTSLIVLRRRMMRIIKDYKSISVELLLKLMKDMYGVYDEKITFQLFSLREKNLITWDGGEDQVSIKNVITYLGD